MIKVLLIAALATAGVAVAAPATTASADPAWTISRAYATLTRVAICGGGTSCAVTQSFGATGYMYRYANYVAYVSSNSTALPPANVQATSNQITFEYDYYQHGG
jgi:hypothetical protein